MDGSVVVLSWDGRDLLQRCLPPLLESLDHCEGRWEIVLVDNGSTDGSLDLVRTRWPLVRIIQNSENLGFSAAANQGIQASTGDLVAFVNNDVVVTPTWLAELERVLEADGSLGSAAAQMRYLDLPEIINSAGITVDISGRAFDRRDGCRVADEPVSPERVFGASAGAAVYRRDVLVELGGFDERFFAYLEDVDLAWRAQRIGRGSAYVPASIVLHEHSATSSRVGGLKAYLSARNHWWVIAKNASVVHLIVAAPLLAALGVWTAFTGIIERQETAGMRGLLDAARALPSMIQERAPGTPLPLRSFDPPAFLQHRRRDRVMRRLPQP